MTQRREYLRGVALTGGVVLTGCTTFRGESENSGNESAGETGAESTADTQSPEAEPIAQADEPEDVVDAEQSAETGLGMRVDDVTECGFTCRTFHLTIQNRGEGVSGLGVEITGYSPDIGDREVYSGVLDIGTIPASHQRSGIEHDIDVGVSDGRLIENNDGRISLQFDLVTDGETVETFRFDIQLDG